MDEPNGVAVSNRGRIVQAAKVHRDDSSDRTLPHDLDAEAVVLSECMNNSDGFSFVAEVLVPEHFYSESNRRIFEVITALSQAGRNVEHMAVAGYLRDADRLAQVGGSAYLVELSNNVPSVARVDEYAKRIIAFARARKLIGTVQQIAAEGYGVHGDGVQEFLDRARDQVVELTESSASEVGRDGPTEGDPLRGLRRLQAAAVLGRGRILELASQPILFIWADIAIAGIIVVIAGGPGSGKTTLLFLLLAARLNHGEPVALLGRTVTPAPEGRYVVLIEAEHGEPSAARKLTKSFALQGIDDQALDRLILVARRSVKLGSPEWAEVGQMVRAGLVSDIALDTLARVAPGDANDEREQAAIFDQIARTIDMAPTEENKPVVWLVTHTRKGDGEELADVSGSAQRTGQADTVLLVKGMRQDGRVTSSKVTFPKLREEPEQYPSPVEYVVTASGVTTIDAATVADGRPLEQRILDRLALGPQTKSGLSTALSANKTLIDDALDALFGAKQIVTTEVTVRGRSFKAFARKEVRP